MNIHQGPFEKDSLLESRYRIQEFIGSGGMGWVFRAKDLGCDSQTIALKVLYPHLLATESAFARFQNEISITRRLSHPSIIQTYGFGRTDDGYAYVAMEYVKGYSLKQFIESPAETDFQTIQKLLFQIVEGLRFAHSNGVIHRDLKPDNILVKDKHVVKIADFGLAQMFRDESHLTRTGLIVGTPFYMAPEQFDGEPVDIRSDIYSLGILAYELAASSPPFRGDTFFEIASQHMKSQLPKLPETAVESPAWFSNFLQRCTSKKREDRFYSSDEVAAFLRSHTSSSIYESSAELISCKEDHKIQETPLWSWLHWRMRLVAVALSSTIFCIVILVLCHKNAWLQNKMITPRVLILEKKIGFELSFIRVLLGTTLRKNDFDILFGEKAYPIEALINGGVNPNTINPKTGDYLIHSFATQSELRPKNYTVMRKLLEKGADINSRNREGKTALFLSVINLHYRLCKLLLKHGANVNVADNSGNTPLIRAVQTQRLKYAQILLAYGADPNLALPNHSTPLHIAAKKQNPSMLKLLLKNGALANTQNDLGGTPLMWAINNRTHEANHKEVIQLLSANSDAKLRDHNGKTAWDLAKEKNDLIALSLLDNSSL